MLFFAMRLWGAASAAFQIVAPNELRADLGAVSVLNQHRRPRTGGPTFTALLTDNVFDGGAGVRYSLVAMAVVLLPISAALSIASRAPCRSAALQARAWTRRE